MRSSATSRLQLLEVLLVSDEGVCRKVPATTGLSKTSVNRVHGRCVSVKVVNVNINVNVNVSVNTNVDIFVNTNVDIFVNTNVDVFVNTNVDVIVNKFF